MDRLFQKKFVVIDGNSLLYRAFYALPLLQNRRGEHTNAIYGFTNMLLKLLEEKKPDYVAVAFDPPRPSFRVRIDPSYKAQREKTPPELSEQVQRVREILAAMRIAVFEVDDYEADDVIGTLADRSVEQALEVTIITGDADLLQLVNDHVTVLLTKKGISQMEHYDRSLLKEQYGLEPQQVIDFKALKGDPSDNIPGVPGIGGKTARRLIEEYGSLEQIYAHMDQFKGKLAQNLEEYREQLFIGRQLVTLCRTVPFDLDWEQCRRTTPDNNLLLPLFNDLGFKSLAAKIQPSLRNNTVQTSLLVNGKIAATEAEVFQLLDKLGAGDTLALLVEYPTGRPYWRQPVELLALATDHGTTYYIEPASFGRLETEIWKKLAATRDKGASLLVHNVKYWHHLFIGYGLTPPVFAFDTQIAAYLTDPAFGSYDLPRILRVHLDSASEISDSREQRAGDLGQRGRQLAEMASQLFALRESLLVLLKEQSLEQLLYQLEMPLAAVLARMERQGVTIDTDLLRDLSDEICNRLQNLELEIYSLAGEQFNLNSPQQLSIILFDKLKLPEGRKTKTGRSTDGRVLEELACHHEIAALLLHYRQLSKLEGTYLSSLIAQVDPQEQKIYTIFNQTVTATGRLSSSEPNLQNIPVRLEEGRRIRRGFIPSTKDRLFLAADYSQVELRILAHLSQDPILIHAFNSGEDIHRRTAAEVNFIPLEEVTPLMREKAKAVNFGIIYGSSDYGLAQGLKISRAEAKAYIDGYFERYRGVKKYMEDIQRQAYEQGYVTTLFNRRRYLPEIYSSNHNTRSFAERMALNTPIQGTAADVIKLAMIKIDQLIYDGGFKAKMLLQIHDELLFEIEETELNFFAPLVRREMEQALIIAVPLQVDLKWGRNWEELKPL
ncbi:MAG TPA: DNA polymerase I [Candidatus Limnocylindrales bacterium]|nr:DNA polymerase I [Candidatus Limnocylindrales bacterium]